MNGPSWRLPTPAPQSLGRVTKDSGPNICSLWDQSYIQQALVSASVGEHILHACACMCLHDPAFERDLGFSVLAAAGP